MKGIQFIIVAGSAREFRDYVKQNSLDPEVCFYPIAESDARKVNPEEVSYHFVGTWFLDDWKVDLLRWVYNRSKGVFFESLGSLKESAKKESGHVKRKS
jgi:hypothetical protein